MRIATMIQFALIFGAVGCSAPMIAGRPNHSDLIVRADSDRLDDLKSAVHDSDNSPELEPKQARPTPCRRCKEHPCTCGADKTSRDENSPISLIAHAIVKLPFVIPIMAIGDDYDHFTEFPDYPYANDVPGSLLIDSEADCKKQSWTGSIQSFAIPGTDDVHRFGGRVVLDSQSRFGMDSEASYWFRSHSDQETTQAWIGDANLTYRFAESERVQMRAGIGINWLADQTRPEAGVNFTYGLEWFPRKPWTVATVIDVGSLGHGGLVHNRTTVGVMMGAAEAFLGYDYFQINDVNIQGPVAGLGWRF